MYSLLVITAITSMGTRCCEPKCPFQCRIRAKDRDDLIEQIEGTHPLYSLIHECVQSEKEKRPNAIQICHDLETKVRSLETDTVAC